VAKILECGAAGPVCGAKVKGETEEEVLEKAVEHARKDHRVDLSGSTTFAGYLRSLIHDESAAEK
jgi:predicted small metal-binding protein